jgi:hypothetical protein
MTQRTFEFKIGTEKYMIELTTHAVEQMEERNVANFAVFGCIVKLGEELTKIEDAKHFGIIDYDTNTGVVCDIHTYGNERLVQPITILGGLKAEDLYVTRGVHVYNVGQLLNEAIQKDINRPIVNITGMKAPERIIEKTQDLLVMFRKTMKFCDTIELHKESLTIEEESEKLLSGTFNSDKEAEKYFEAFKVRTNKFIDKALGL